MAETSTIERLFRVCEFAMAVFGIALLGSCLPDLYHWTKAHPGLQRVLELAYCNSFVQLAVVPFILTVLAAARGSRRIHCAVDRRRAALDGVLALNAAVEAARCDTRWPVFELPELTAA